MKSLKDEFDIRLFSHLIQTVLCCRLNKKNDLSQQIELTISKLQSEELNDRLDLNFGIQTISKLHEGSDFKVNSLLRKHFLSHDTKKYCIYLQIFTLHNKSQQSFLGGKQDKNKLIQKWVFRKSTHPKTTHSDTSLNSNQSDLIFKVLTFINQQNHAQKSQNGNITEINNNTTVTKGYQLVIKTSCSQKNKHLIHVLHLQKNITSLEAHKKSLKSSLLQLPNFWEKSLQFHTENTFFVGCYFQKPLQKVKNQKIETASSEVLRLPDRKMSSETKAQQKESTCSFKFSLENFSFRLSGNKAFKQRSDVQPIRKTSQQIANLHRPRYQSIYESKDEEMNIYILSPRKLSEDQSPKMRHLQQKPIQFEITEQRGISQEMIEEFILEPEDLMSNGSSEGFQMLEENDQLDSIREQRSQKILGRSQQQRVRKKEVLAHLNQIQNELISHLRSIDKSPLLSD